VPGTPGWAAAVDAAKASGAIAVVVTGPVPVAPAELDALTARAGDIPIILDRARLRADVAEDAAGAGGGAPLHTAQCTASATAIAGAICDAIGWLRVLSTGPVRLRSAATTAHGAVALLDAGGDAATLTATVLATDGGRIAVSALGVVRTDVAIATPQPARVTRDDGSGAVTLPTRWESHDRLALRRAIDAVIAGERPTDVADFAHDARLGASIWPSVHPHKH